MENKIERTKAVLAMEYIARQINDEEIFDIWLTYGPGDGEIEYGCLDDNHRDLEWISDYYGGGKAWTQEEADEHFQELMDLFLNVIGQAKRSGGLYCGGITTKAG